MFAMEIRLDNLAQHEQLHVSRKTTLLVLRNWFHAQVLASTLPASSNSTRIFCHFANPTQTCISGHDDNTSSSSIIRFCWLQVAAMTAVAVAVAAAAMARLHGFPTRFGLQSCVSGCASLP